MTTHVRPPDLEMQVKTMSESGRTRLLYTLHSPTGVVDFSHQEITGPLLQGRPEDFQAQLRRKIEQLGSRLDVDGTLLLQADIERKLASLGHDLWRELFPPEIHHAYREIRKSVHSWMIVSDEPWIPWELIRPYDDFDDAGNLVGLVIPRHRGEGLAVGRKPHAGDWELLLRERSHFLPRLHVPGGFQ